MIILVCSNCGHEITVGDSMRDTQVRCARCGNKLSARTPEVSSTEIRPAPILTPLINETTGQSDADETLKPRPGAHALTFPFLSPAKEPTELGWLGHYQVLRLLGQGGMGIVFEAFDTHLHRPVALKVMKSDLAQDESSRQRFLREARAMAAVKSDHVVTVHEVGQRNNIPFLAMEFLQGEPMDTWLKHCGRLSMPDIVRLAGQIARGLAAAHERGLIHRDIKPGNIFLEAVGGDQQAAGSRQHPAGSDPNISTLNTVIQVRPPITFDNPVRLTSCRPKILDFGLVRETNSRAQLTDPGLLVGTPAYMSPEQVEGQPVDARCDLFSFGCILYELVTGQQPFTGPSSLSILMAVATKHPKPPREVNPDVPPPLAKLILQLLAKKPQDRPANARAVVTALEGVTDAIATPTPAGPRVATSILNGASLRWTLMIWLILAAGTLGMGLVWLVRALLID